MEIVLAIGVVLVWFGFHVASFEWFVWVWFARVLVVVLVDLVVIMGGCLLLAYLGWLCAGCVYIVLRVVVLVYYCCLFVLLVWFDSGLLVLVVV